MRRDTDDLQRLLARGCHREETVAVHVSQPANPYADNKLPKRERVVFEIAPDAIRSFDEAAARRGFASRAEVLRHLVLQAMTTWSNGDQRK